MSWDDRFAQAEALTAKGLFNAAEELFRTLEFGATDQSKLGRLYYEQGNICLFKDANYKEAVTFFTKAIELASNSEEKTIYTMYLAIAYLKMAEFDTCYRYLSTLAENTDGLTDTTIYRLWGNLSIIQAINGFFDQSIATMERIKHFLNPENPEVMVIWNSNAGLAYIEMGKYDEAESHLKQAFELGGDNILETVSELGRLCLFQGRMNESVLYAEKALKLVWSSIINYSKEEVARLCYLLANICAFLEEPQLAVRLGEKAQVFFGQLGMWRQWQNVESQLEQWFESTPGRYSAESYRQISFAGINHFLQCLEALNAQELIHTDMSRLIDLRVYYAKLFAQELNLSLSDQDDLVLAGRFADYGLTALENEVVLNPNRSEVAYIQYKQHPLLSVRLVQTLNLSEGIVQIIQDHHEAFDGSGYPNGKQAEEINYLARIMGITDKYSFGIVMEQKSHSELLEEIRTLSGTAFDPDLVDAFENMFVVSQ